MKVRIYKAPDGKGKLVKAKDGMAVNTDKEIKRKIAEGKDPEIIIYEMAEFGLSRPEARDRVYKLYDLLGDDDYDEDEVVAPYDEPVEEEVAEVVEEEEPDNAAIYDYYGGDNQGLAVVNDGADDEDEDEEARYGGQYAEGGQFAPGSIIPKPKKPYYIGMDAEPYDNAYAFGGLTKGAYVKKRIKELRKAAQGDEVQNNETNISPRGTIDSPSGFTSPEKNLASVIKQNANEAMLKQQAENEYQQYQNSTMGQDFNGKFLFGGRNRKIRRANRAMFGTPIAIPGVDVSYEFGPLGGLRKAEANWDLDAIGDLAKLLPGAMNMMPGMFPGVFPGMMPGGMSYKKVSYPAQVRKKTITAINNAALDDVANQNPNSTAAQNNRTDKKNELKCPPGAVYDPSLGHCIDQEGNRVRSIVDLPDPEELLGNPFENPNARMLNGKKTMKATGPSSSTSSTAASQSTQARSVGGAPLQSEQNKIPGLIDYGQDWAGNVAKSEEIYKDLSKKENLLTYPPEDPSQYGYMIDPATGEVVKNPKGTNVDQRGLVWSGKYDDENTGVDESLVWSNPMSAEEWEKHATYDNEQSYIVTNPDGTQSSVMGSVTGSEFSPWNIKMEEASNARKKAAKQQASYIANMPKDVRAKNYKEINKGYGSDILDANGNFTKDYKNYFSLENNPVMDYDFIQKQFGGPILGVGPDEYGNLQKFIYGGDEYAYGGDVLPKAYDGFITNFQKQMDATKSRIDQMGNKKPEELLGNPFRGNAFGNATTGIQPSGTVGNRFQPSGQPNTGTTTQGGTGTSGGGRGIMSQQRSEELSTMTPEQRRAELEKGKRDFDNWFNSGVQQQFMQMMQGQPGMGQGQFWTGRPQRLGFGLTRDFNYTSGFSPVNWQVPEGTKGVKQTAYKDRGKWWNPFDTKRITEWRIDNGEAVPTDPSKTGTQDGTGEDEAETTGKRFAKGMKIGKDEMLMTNVDAEGNPMGIDSKGRLVNADANVETPAPDKMPTRGASQIPTSVSGPAPETIQTQGESAVSASNPFAGNAFSGNQFGSASTGIEPSGNLKSAQSPNDFTMTGQSNVSSNPFTGNAFGTESTGVSGNIGSRPAAPSPSYPSPGQDNPMADPKFVPTPQDYNPGVPRPRIKQTRRDDPNASPGEMYDDRPEKGLDYVDPLAPLPMAYGGYVPEYMAYGGYIPMAKSGITAGKPEFEDPNLIGRTVEQSAYTFNPGQFATDLFSGPTSLTGLTTNILNARDEARKMDQAAQRNRTSDAATANTGQSGFGSAERKGSDLMATGNETQYGSTPGKQGYEGGLYGKKGGSMNTQYAKGKVYSLTMDQIKAIEAAGGKVEYIK